MAKVTAAQIVQRHYGLDRKVTEQEVRDEIANVVRKYERGSLDDFAFNLYSSLDVSGFIK